MARTKTRTRKRKTSEELDIPKSRIRKKKMQSLVPTKLSKKPKPTRLVDLEYDPKIFETMKTNTIVDEFFSNKGGIPRACNFIVVGDPGAGKSTIGLDIISNIGLNPANPQRVLFISGEMNEIDMYEYMERYPKFGQIDILFLSDYDDENPKLVIEEMLDQGYDLVLGDSFVEIADSVKEACYMTSTGAEKWLIELMCQHNKGKNKRKCYTTFLMIQQVTKGGTFVGSNKLKHNTTGMLEIRFSSADDISSPRYIEFTKNRRGDVQKQLYFNLSIPDNVAYNADKWKADKDAAKRMNKEMDELIAEAAAFDALLKLPADGEQPASLDPEAVPVTADMDDEFDDDDND